MSEMQHQISRRRLLGSFGLLPVASRLAAPLLGAPLLATPVLWARRAGAQAGNVDTKALYRLGTGDKLKLTVFGEDDLSGEFEVDESGAISLPLIGEIEATGKSSRELERTISAALADGYLISPRVNIEVLNYRPYFILGEVKEPGKYPYVNGMSILNAVAVAGGYTYRARKEEMVVIRGGENGEQVTVQENTLVLPGDIIRVPERLF